MILKAPWQWVASPLGLNMLLSMLKENSPTVEKYTQMAKILENTEGCKLKNRIFVSSSKDTSKLGQFTDVEKTDFSKNENTFTIYNRWRLNNRSGLLMKIYNSFNYADDVRYEGRLMEVPFRSEDFKLVLVLPNESDVIVNTLFATLTNQGLAAAINSIQPLFTANTALSTPISIDVKSRVQIKKKISAISNGFIIQYGTTAVSDEGTQVKVLTCLCLPADTVINSVDHVTLKPGTPPAVPPLSLASPPFYFAVVYKDTPIFYGDFKKRMGTQNS